MAKGCFLLLVCFLERSSASLEEEGFCRCSRDSVINFGLGFFCFFFSSFSEKLDEEPTRNTFFLLFMMFSFS